MCFISDQKHKICIEREVSFVMEFQKTIECAWIILKIIWWNSAVYEFSHFRSKFFASWSIIAWTSFALALFGSNLYPSHQSSCSFNSNHPLSHAQNLGIVAQDSPLHTEAVVSCHCPDTWHFVCADSDSQARPAGENCSIYISWVYELCCIYCDVGISSFVSSLCNSDISDRYHSLVGTEIGIAFLYDTPASSLPMVIRRGLTSESTAMMIMSLKGCSLIDDFSRGIKVG